MAKQKRGSAGPMAGIIGLGLILVMIFLVTKMVTGVFTILSWIALPLFLIALVLNYRVVTDYFNWVAQNIRKEPAKGLVIAGASILGYPLVAAWLAFKAYTTKKLGLDKKKKEEKKGDYLKYEEVEAEESDDFLELDDLDKPKQKVKVQQTRSKSDSNDYDDLFS